MLLTKFVQNSTIKRCYFCYFPYKIQCKFAANFCLYGASIKMQEYLVGCFPIWFQSLFFSFRYLILYWLIICRYPAHTYIHKELSQESCLHHENIIYGRGTHKTWMLCLEKYSSGIELVYVCVFYRANYFFIWFEY